MKTVPTPLEAVIFDLDGTLVDTAEEFVTVVQALRQEHELPPMDEERIRASVSNGARALVSLALNIDLSHPELEQKRQRLLTLYQQVLGNQAMLYPGIQALLDALRTRDIPWGIATNKPRLYTEILLDKLAITPPPATVSCPDDVSQSKPHPEALLLNCSEIGCRPQNCIYIGDHSRDIEAGRAAGMYTIAATYGYIEPDDKPELWGADACVSRAGDLIQTVFGSDQQ